MPGHPDSHAPALVLASAAFTATVCATADDSIDVALALVALAATIYLYRKNSGALKMFFCASVLILLRVFMLTPDTVIDYSPSAYSGIIVQADAGERGQSGVVLVPGIGRVNFVVIDLVPELHAGDDIEFSGELMPPGRYSSFPGIGVGSMSAKASRISASVVLAPADIKIVGKESGLWYSFSGMRRQIADAVYASDLEPSTARLLVSAFLGTSDAPPGLRDAFRVSGLSHLLCVSGFHVGLVAFVISLLFAPMRLWRARPRLWQLPALAVVWLYALMVGLAPSVIRAAVMISVYGIARILERTPRPVNTFCVAFFTVLAIDPFWLYSAGFQLSFSAVAGLLILTPRLNPVRRENRVLHRICSAFAIPLAAMLATAPVVLMWFGHLPLLSVPANALVAMLFPVFMIVGALAVLAGMWGVGGILTTVTDTLHHCLSVFADRVATLSENVNIVFFPGMFTVVALVAAIIALAIALHSPRLRIRSVTAMCVCLLCCGCEDRKSSGFIAIDGDSRGTSMLLVRDFRAEIYATSHHPLTSGLSRLLKSYGFEPDSIGIADMCECEGVSGLWSVDGCDVLVLGRIFHEALTPLIAESRPSLVVLGADMDHTRRSAYAEICRRHGVPCADMHTAAYFAEL